MKKFGFGLLAALLLAAATVMTTAPAMAGRGGNGMIWIPPMGGGMGGGIGEWHGGGMRQPGFGGGLNRPAYRNNWHAPGGINGKPGWSGKPTKGWNNNWYRNGRWYGPRYRNRYPGYNYFYGGFWYPWPWWSNAWNLQIGDNYGYYGGGYYRNAGSRHVAWCQGRYRSYNARTNSYTGYDGRRRICNSPYD